MNIITPTTQTPANPVANGTPCSITAEAESIVTLGFEDFQPFTPNPSFPDLIVNVVSQTTVEVSNAGGSGFDVSESVRYPYNGKIVDLSFDLNHTVGQNWMVFRGYDGAGTANFLDLQVRENPAEGINIKTRTMDLFVPVEVSGKTFSTTYTHDNGTTTLEISDSGGVVYSTVVAEDYSDIEEVYTVLAAEAVSSPYSITNLQLSITKKIDYSVTADTVEVSTTLPYIFTAGTTHPFGTVFEVLASDDGGQTWMTLGSVDLQLVQPTPTPKPTTCVGYGANDYYGLLSYKGECDIPRLKPLDLLIEQYANSYINSNGGSNVTTSGVSNTDIGELITVGNISALGLIEQFQEAYING